jgi:hypothetical protein
VLVVSAVWGGWPSIGLKTAVGTGGDQGNADLILISFQVEVYGIAEQLTLRATRFANTPCGLERKLRVFTQGYSLP